MNASNLRPPRNGAGSDDLALDALLRTALQARPEPAAPADLAAQAMQLAHQFDTVHLDQRAHRLARQRWWMQVTGLAASLLIAAMVYGAARSLYARGDVAALLSSGNAASTQMATTSGTGADAATAATVDETSLSAKSRHMFAVVLVGGVLLIAVVLLTLPRTGPPAAWNAEALARFW